MTVHFHDVSAFQGDYHPTGPTIIKATEGTSYTNPFFTVVRDRCVAAGFPWLAYHFLWPGDIDAQLQHAHSVVGDQPIMLDVETTQSGTFPSPSDVDEFMSRAPVTLAYIPQWFWQGKWGAPSLTFVSQRGAGLISSNFTTYSDTGPGWAPYGGVTPVIWQYSDNPIDTNAYQGGTEQLLQLFQHGVIPDMTPEQDAMLKTVTAFMFACGEGADSYWTYATDGSRKSTPMAKYWTRIAAEVAKNQAPVHFTGTAQFSG
jgi:hypothetical protein